MPLEVTRIGYMAILEATQDEEVGPSIKRFLDTRGHLVRVIDETEEQRAERLSKGTEELINELLKLHQ